MIGFALGPGSIGGPARFGPQLVSEGSFDVDTGAWTKEAGWTISGGRANAAIAGANSFLYQPETELADGAVVEVSFRLTVASGGVRPLLYGNGFVAIGVQRTLSGLWTERLTLAPGGSRSSQIAFQPYDSSAGLNFTGSIDDVSVRRVLIP